MKHIFMILSVFCVAATTSLYASNTDADLFIWNEANTLMSNARSKEDFTRAAEVYNKLIERGTKNSDILYNLGTALVLAGDYDNAAEALIRAERYSGTTWSIKRNLTLALAEGDNARIVPLPWYRYPLFWHYLLSLSQRISLAICAYSLFWLSLILRLYRFRAIASTITVISVAFLILFGSSAATSVYHEHIAPNLSISPLITTAPLQLGEPIKP